MDTEELLIILAVVGLGGVVVWLLMRDSKKTISPPATATGTPGLNTTTGGYSDPTSLYTKVITGSAPYVVSDIGSSLGFGNTTHSQAKAGVTNVIGNALGLPKGVTNTLNKLDISAYAEDAVQSGVKSVANNLVSGIKSIF
jgi:hypothetical protein